MKRYRVSMCYTGYMDLEIEAENDADAWTKAYEQEARTPTEVGELTLWREASSIEEIKDEPEEGDFVIRSCGRLLADTMVSIVGGGFAVFSGEEQETEARAYIKDRMERDNFFPTVWLESDHGNLSTVNIWNGEE